MNVADQHTAFACTPNLEVAGFFARLITTYKTQTRRPESKFLMLWKPLISLTS